MSLRNPVKYPVKYYSWQDTQAPQLSNADGVIKTILKACLVTGYGSKAGAGWTSPFEDDYRIVLRRPLRTGNPPDIKIENGVINGATSHRIIAQDNPASIDDTNQLSTGTLLARGSFAGEWYFMATDFAFIFYYTQGSSRTILYCGEVMKVQESSQSIHILTYHQYVNSQGATGDTGSPSASTYTFMGGSFIKKNMITGGTYGVNYLEATVNEMFFNNDYFAQKIIIGAFDALFPFFTAVTKNVVNANTSIIKINSRDFLRCISQGSYYNGGQPTSQPRAFYIPLDYWEL